MDSINSWINEEEVRKLAEDLTKAPKEISKESLERTKVVTPGKSIEQILKEETNKVPDGAVRIPNELKAEKALSHVKPSKDSIEVILKEKTDVVSEDGSVRIPNELKAEKALSLANASAMAASVGLINTKPVKSTQSITAKGKTSEVTNQATALCDNFLNAVPVNIDTREKKQISIPAVHSEKGVGTFGEIDKELKESLKTNGICVIDRDGDVLYSSIDNKSLVTFTIDTMMMSKLMHTKEGEVGNVRLKLSADDFMEFVSVKSTRGVIVLSTILKDSLGSKKAKQVADDMLKIANKA